MNYSLYLFHEGTLFESYQMFGAHIFRDADRVKTRFCVWAPHAETISLVGDFNNWNGNGYTFHKVNKEGVWVLAS